MSDNIRSETRSSSDPADLPGGPPTVAPTVSEWGLASLLLAVAFGVAIPSTFSLLLALDIDNWNHIGLKPVTALLGYVAGVVMILLCLTAAGFGLVGMASRRPGQSVALGLAGLLLGVLDALVWLVLLLCWNLQAARYLM